MGQVVMKPCDLSLSLIKIVHMSNSQESLSNKQGLIKRKKTCKKEKKRKERELGLQSCL